MQENVSKLNRELDARGLTLAAFTPDGGRVLYAARGEGYYLAASYDCDGVIAAGGRYDNGFRTGRALFDTLPEALAWIDDRRGGLAA
jgi:hypothetical protein